MFDTSNRWCLLVISKDAFQAIRASLFPQKHGHRLRKEIPLMVEAGKRLNPEVHWYADESCLDHTYDLVMINGSLQYFEQWPDIVRRLARVANKYLFLTRLPVVDKGPSFVAIQRAYETEMMHQQFNQDEVLRVVEATGLQLVREFVVGDRPYIHGAPEQCEFRGWLFQKTDSAGPGKGPG